MTNNYKYGIVDNPDDGLVNYSDLFKDFKKCIDNTNNKVISVLSEFGVGKTSFVKQYLKKYKSDYIDIYIDLSRFHVYKDDEHYTTILKNLISEINSKVLTKNFPFNYIDKLKIKRYFNSISKTDIKIKIFDNLEIPFSFIPVGIVRNLNFLNKYTKNKNVVIVLDDIDRTYDFKYVDTILKMILMFKYDTNIKFVIPFGFDKLLEHKDIPKDIEVYLSKYIDFNFDFNPDIRSLQFNIISSFLNKEFGISLDNSNIIKEYLLNDSTYEYTAVDEIFINKNGIDIIKFCCYKFLVNDIIKICKNDKLSCREFLKVFDLFVYNFNINKEFHISEYEKNKKIIKSFNGNHYLKFNDILSIFILSFIKVMDENLYESIYLNRLGYFTTNEFDDANLVNHLIGKNKTKYQYVLEIFINRSYITVGYIKSKMYIDYIESLYKHIQIAESDSIESITKSYLSFFETGNVDLVSKNLHKNYIVFSNLIENFQYVNSPDKIKNISRLLDINFYETQEYIKLYLTKCILNYICSSIDTFEIIDVEKKYNLVCYHLFPYNNFYGIIVKDMYIKDIKNKDNNRIVQKYTFDKSKHSLIFSEKSFYCDEEHKIYKYYLFKNVNYKELFDNIIHIRNLESYFNDLYKYYDDIIRHVSFEEFKKNFLDYIGKKSKANIRIHLKQTDLNFYNKLHQ